MDISVYQSVTIIFLWATCVFCLASASASWNWNGEVADRCFCKLKEEVDDCFCKVETLDSLNNKKIYPRLNSLLARNYFRYFKVNLQKTCPFWTDDSRCALKDCHVNVCKKEDVPISEKAEEHDKNKYLKEANKDHENIEESCEEERQLGALNTTISDDKKAEFQSWNEHDESLPLFCDFEDEHSNGLEYVDLLLNPERYTGYKGLSPLRIWRTIYEENCFQPEENFGYGGQMSMESYLEVLSSGLPAMCLEKRAFYRLISGLHTSINIHLCDQYLFPAKTAFGPGVWDHNLEEFQRRFDPQVTNDQGPQRLKNLYFVYLIELRALAKAAPYLKAENFYTGEPSEDADIQKVIHQFLDIVISFPDQFDESQLFKGNSKQTKKLKLEFVHHFRNISRIMDCVGCDKCKLWGKLQILGMGTALKILFSGDSMAPDSTVNANTKEQFQLTRTEIVALFNAFGRLSSSIHAIENFRKLAR